MTVLAYPSPSAPHARRAHIPGSAFTLSLVAALTLILFGAAALSGIPRPKDGRGQTLPGAAGQATTPTPTPLPTSTPFATLLPPTVVPGGTVIISGGTLPAPILEAGTARITLGPILQTNPAENTFTIPMRIEGIGRVVPQPLPATVYLWLTDAASQTTILSGVYPTSPSFHVSILPTSGQYGVTAIALNPDGSYASAPTGVTFIYNAETFTLTTLGGAALLPMATALPTATPISGNPATGMNCVYTVQAGDTLISIAAQFGVTIDFLQGMYPSPLQVGQQVIIPNCIISATAPIAPPQVISMGMNSTYQAQFAPGSTQITFTTRAEAEGLVFALLQTTNHPLLIDLGYSVNAPGQGGSGGGGGGGGSAGDAMPVDEYGVFLHAKAGDEVVLQVTTNDPSTEGQFTLSLYQFTNIPTLRAETPVKGNLTTDRPVALYTFTPERDGEYGVTVSAEGNADLQLLFIELNEGTNLYRSYVNGCHVYDQVFCMDRDGGAGRDPELLGVPLKAGRRYTVAVYGAAAGVEASFTVQVGE